MHDLYFSGSQSSSAIFWKALANEWTSDSTSAAKDWYVALARARSCERDDNVIFHTSAIRLCDPSRRREYVRGARSFIVLVSWIETDERKPGRYYTRTLPRNATRERVENSLEGGRKTGEWNADSRMHLVTLPGRQFLKNFLSGTEMPRTSLRWSLDPHSWTIIYLTNSSNYLKYRQII